MKRKNLYHVQDSDRPMWVIASNWTEAVHLWKMHVAAENDQTPVDVPECQGIQLICEANELISSDNGASENQKRRMLEELAERACAKGQWPIAASDFTHWIGSLY